MSGVINKVKEAIHPNKNHSTTTTHTTVDNHTGQAIDHNTTHGTTAIQGAAGMAGNNSGTTTSAVPGNGPVHSVSASYNPFKQDKIGSLTRHSQILQTSLIPAWIQQLAPLVSVVSDTLEPLVHTQMQLDIQGPPVHTTPPTVETLLELVLALVLALVTPQLLRQVLMM
jgi:hypothetical protein